MTAGGNEFAIRPDLFHRQFAADVPAASAAIMAATQRPVTEAALSTGLAAGVPAWKTIPSWFVFGDEDLNIPVALHRFMAQRAGAKDAREVRGGSHALSVFATRCGDRGHPPGHPRVTGTVPAVAPRDLNRGATVAFKEV